MFHPIGPKTGVQVVRIQFPQLGTTRVLGSGPHSSLAQLAELSTGCADRLGDKLGTDTGFGLLQETLSVPCVCVGWGQVPSGEKLRRKTVHWSAVVNPGTPPTSQAVARPGEAGRARGALCAWAQHGRKGLHWMGAPGHAG